MGRIGKPQKSKKHKKVKPFDPSIEGDRKSFRQDRTSNRPPKDEDSQEIPRKVQFYIENKGNFPKKKHKRRNKFKPEDDPSSLEKGMTKPMKPAPKFVQRKHESENKFFRRMDRETQDVILKAQLSDKYKINFDEEGNQIKKKKKMNKAKKMRLKEKKTWIKEKKKDKKGDFAHLNDKVQFGEVVMAPPSLTAKPRKAPTSEDSVPRPGKKSLLLKEVLASNRQMSSGKNMHSSQREIGQSLKRKHLSLSQQQKMDAEREKAIELYRQLKGKKLKMSLPS